MKLRDLGVPKLVGTVVSCYEGLKEKFESICGAESYFGIIGFKDGIMQSVSLKGLEECDDLIPFCVQCAFVYNKVRYSVFYGLNNYSIINTFGRVHNNNESLDNGNLFNTPLFRPNTMNINLVEGYRDFMSITKEIYSYGYVFNALNINEFRLIDAYDITEPEHISRVFERIENFIELYYTRIVEAMQDKEFFTKMNLLYKTETELLPERKKASNAIKLNLAFNSFCNGNYRDASKKFHNLKNILTQYEIRRLNYIDSVLNDGKQIPVIESDVYNYVQKGKRAVRNESLYVIISILIAFPVTFLSSLLVFLFTKSTYFNLFTKNKALLILEPDISFYFILALLTGAILLFPGFKIVMKIFFQDKGKNDNQNRKINAYIRKATLWPTGIIKYFFNIMMVLIFFGFGLLVNNNLIFYRDEMVISNGNLMGVNKQVIDYSEIINIYSVTKAKREDGINEDLRLYYLYLKNNTLIKAENIFTSKSEFIEKGLPKIVSAIEKEPIEVGFFEEIPQ